ncbi:MAG: DUF1552 domain-containing protein, partial [Myxococcota bacterium]
QSVCHFREVQVNGSGHGNARKCMGALRWSRDWTSDTIDQQIASVLGTSSPYTSYALGVQTNTQNLVTRRGGSAIPAQNDPAAAYSQLFGAPPPNQDRSGLLARKTSIMDLHREALSELKTKLGTFELQTLESHETALAAVKARITESLTTEPAEGCTNPAWNAGGYPTSPPAGGPGVFAHQAELQSDIIAAAFRCGLTNVMTLQLGWHQATWYGHDTSFRGDHHNSCHGAGAMENAEMTNYLSRCVAYLVQKLLDEDDPAVPGTKLLDNTVVVQVTDMGDGRDHSGGNGPNVIATRMPSFRVGQATRGGDNYQLLEAVVEGLGLGAYKGTNVDTDKIWPCADGQVETAVLT